LRAGLNCMRCHIGTITPRRQGVGPCATAELPRWGASDRHGGTSSSIVSNDGAGNVMEGLSTVRRDYEQVRRPGARGERAGAVGWPTGGATYLRASLRRTEAGALPLPRASAMDPELLRSTSDLGAGSRAGGRGAGAGRHSGRGRGGLAHDDGHPRLGFAATWRPRDLLATARSTKTGQPPPRC